MIPEQLAANILDYPSHWGMRNLYQLSGLGLNNYRDMMAASAKPPRPDLTARQIEWCRANIPAFMPKGDTR